MKGLFMTGTDTDVGKTWVGSQLVFELIKQGINVKARKPIESGWPDEDSISDSDAWKLANAVGQIKSLDLVCPNRFKAPISPDRAAKIENQNITLQQLHNDCLKSVAESDFLYVEGAGGFYSPICSNGLNADLAASLNLPVVLVVEDKLGCINQTLLNVEAIAKQNLELTAIALNHTKLAKKIEGMDNFTDIQKRVDCKVITFGYCEQPIEAIQNLAKFVTNK